MTTRHRRYPLFVLLGCIWVVSFKVSAARLPWSVAISPIWVIAMPIQFYPISLLAGILLAILPTRFAAWRLSRSGYQVKL